MIGVQVRLKILVNWILTQFGSRTDKIDLFIHLSMTAKLKKALNTAYTSYVNGETDYDTTIKLSDQLLRTFTTLDWDE